MTKTVLVGGCFDLLHYGHLTFLKKAREFGDRLVVMLESDEFIRRHKKREPIHTQEERAEILLALEQVDRVVKLPYLSGYEDYLKIVKSIHPQVIAITGDDPQKENKQKQAQTIQAELKIATQRIENLSTSQIIQDLLD